MKCQATVDGEVCGTDIPPNTKFCPECGNKVVKKDDNSTRPCQQCSNIVTERQRFCTTCGFKVDPSIFEEKKILCLGLLDGKQCGAELLPTTKFCQECGSEQGNYQSTGPEKDVPSPQPNTESQTSDNNGSDKKQQKIHTRLDGSSESGSSSRSGSPDTWKAPSALVSTPESVEDYRKKELEMTENKNEDGRKLDKQENDHKDSEEKRQRRESNESSSGDLEVENRSPNNDIRNNNYVDQDMLLEGQEQMEIDDPQTASQAMTHAENSNTTIAEIRQTLNHITSARGEKPTPITASLTDRLQGGAEGVAIEIQGETSSSGNEITNNRNHGLVAKNNVRDNNVTPTRVNNEQASRGMDMGPAPKCSPVNTISTNSSEGMPPHRMTMGDMPPSKGDMSSSTVDMPPSTGDMPSSTSDMTPSTGDMPPSLSDMPPSTGDMAPSTGDMPPSTGQSQVKEFTKQFERSLSVETNDRTANGNKRFKRGMSQSSGEASDGGSENESGAESSSGEDEGGDNVDQASSQQTGGKGRKNKPKGAKEKRKKKRDRKERNQKRKMNLPETDTDFEMKNEVSNQGSMPEADEKNNLPENGKIIQQTKEKPSNTKNYAGQEARKDEGNGGMHKTAEKNNLPENGKTTQKTNEKPSNLGNNAVQEGRKDEENKGGQTGVPNEGTERKTKDRESENQPYNLRSGTKNKDNQKQAGDNDSNKTAKVDGNNTKSASEKETANKTKGQKRLEFSDVYFHVVVSPSLLADQNTGSVHIHFQASTLHGWKSRKHELKFRSKLADGFLQYEGLVRIPKELLGSPLLYSYYAVRSGNHVVNEYIYCHSSESNNRTLVIGREKIRDTIHQFDGVIKEKPESNKGMIKMFKGMFGVDDYKKELKKEACFAFRAMAPQVQLSMTGTSAITGEEIIYYFDRLINGLQTTYQVTAGLWYDSRTFLSALTKDIHEYIAQQLARIHEHRKVQKEEDCIFVLSAAIALFTIKDLNDVELTDSEDDFLCRSLLPTLNKKRICPEYEGLKGYFPNTMKKIKSSLLSRVKKFAGESTKTCWLFCIPLLHYLNDKYTPYQLPTAKVNHNDEEPDWWGIVGFNREVDYFKYKSKWDRKKADLLLVLEPYFTVDFLLPRTFMACLSLHHVIETINLELLPTDAILATLYFYIKTNNYLGKDSLKGIRKTFPKLTTRLLKMAEDQNLPIEYALRNFRIASNVMDGLYPKFIDDKTFVCLLGVEVVLVAVAWFTNCLKKRQAEGKDGNYKEHLTCFDYHRDHIKHMLCDEYFFHYEEQFLMVWNEALKLKIPSGEIRDVYMKYIRDELEQTLTQRSSGVETKIVQLYCENLESYCDPVQEILSKLAYKAVEKGASIQYTGTGIRGTSLIKYGHLLSTVFERSMDLQHMVGYHKILNYCLNWAPFSLYVKIFYHPEYSKSLSEQSSLLMSNFLEVLKRTSEDAVKGTILIQDLQGVLRKFEHFKSIIMEVKDLPVKAEYLMATLPLREKELLAYQKTLKIVQNFVYMCGRFEGDTDSLEEKIKRYEQLDNVSLHMLCKIGMLEDMKNRENYQPSVIAFGLEDHVLQTIPYILQCGNGLLFMTLWDKKGQEQGRLKGKLLDIDEILEEVWQPTYKFWTDLCKRLQSGDLKFSEFEKYFRTTHLESLEEELVKLSSNGDTRWVKVRLDQLQKYRSLRSCLYGAQAIMDVVGKYDLKGNFNQILEILNLAEDSDTKMNTLDDSMMETCQILSGINENKANCLKIFCQCKDLVDWLRSTMPSGLKELKVFVDLASISAGEGDYEIGKVNCLHSATTGYAPLIFNLDKDCNAVSFLGKCQEVWKELGSNPTLPKKLTDTQRQLDWLKSVKQTHGSVEVTSLAQVEAINGNGIYQVGNLKKTATIKNPTLSGVLELRVTETEGQKLQRNQYRYEHLHDLQSRLMLVAGKAEKGKDAVDRFMLILDSVVRLGNIYTKLVAEGCVLFSQWHVKFLCDPTRTACAFINFGFGEEKHTLKGRIDQQSEDVSAIIPKLAKFLEQCHQKWLNYIDERREKYYLLNYFTVDQMVILQQELVKIGSEVEPSELIYPMLSSVKQDCTKEDLVRAMTSAKQDVETMDSRREQEMEKGSEDDEMESESMTDDAKVAKFLQVVTEIYSIELAREALKHVSADEIDEGLEWCMENEDDFIPDNTKEDTPMDDDDRSRETTAFKGWTETGQSLASITANLVSQLGMESRENSVDKLIRALEDLWQTFLNSISSSVSDYLSVEHLGLILNRLAEQEEMVIDRTFLPSFTPGEPNLIICPQSEIYNTVLTVYSHEDDKPLPQHDEVLLCTPQTTLDMLEIFWRRVLFADNNKVYCLVNADLLDYDVSDRGERTLERLMKNAENKGIKYKLVVICSSENEYKSRVVAALDKFHRPQLPIDVNNVREYLLTKLRVDKDQSGTRPACSVDFEKCTVRVVKSWRAGVGKTLYKKRMVTDLAKLVPNIPRRVSSNVTIPLHEKAINTDSIMDIFLLETLPPRCNEPRIFHIDISHEVQDGVDAFLFQLLVLGCLGHSSGYIWRKSDLDYYIIESMPLLVKGSDSKLKCLHHCLDILPHVLCRSPQESLDILTDVRKPPDYTDHDRLFDALEFKSTTFQRPFQYLKRLDTNCKLDDVNAHVPEGDKKQCLQTLLRHCGIKDPSWSELHHFVSFLNKQLENFNGSAFCGLAAMDDLPGFAKFVLRFLIQMSRDFSTRSLKVSEESPIQMLQRQISDDEEEKEDDNVIQLYQMRRKWETSPHPYLFFNPDHHSMTFLGFNIDRRSGNLIDLQTKEILEQGIMQQNLFDALVRNRVNLAENFDALPRAEKIMKLCNVMGLDMVHDPDDTYELTTDNVKKILAIYMRFRCDIPVIIMGETGCGKTRLIKFMCSLQQPPGVTVENMILMKVHGGTKVSDIVRKVKKAEEIAQKNATDYPLMDTVLFFDEANTTEAIGVIKEIMCDKSLCGKPIKLHEKLKIVAACNPYRKHSDELIKRLEQAGLGYHVDADKTTDKLGRVPMRRLVYRVQPLPQSMLPLVWDFGQLNTEVEEMYIRQMVLRYINNGKLPSLQGLEDVVSKILTVSQDFMRDQKDECSFVSLRDVERVLEVMSWFYRQSEDDNLLFQKMKEQSDSYDSNDEEMEVAEPPQTIDDITRSLVLALGVCYHACLKNRDEYRAAVAGYFRPPLVLPNGADQIKDEISNCQTVFLENVELAANIAKNQALKENVFMMIVCIELRIPMFLVGKPGSSKSLAKTIVADAMQGNAAHKDLFKNYKQAQMVSYQCSPISVPEGIVGTFKQCAAYQKDKDLGRFVSIVVLDEIGLAEDSPRMPLKTLHPLLEDGCPDDEDPEPYKKVAFIGISNWALDPAKMNRGILVQREVPDITELKESAEGICSTNDEVLKLIKPMIEPMADSYLELFGDASKEMREFFGLRDFYSLLKMLYAFVSQPRIPCKPTWLQLKHAILRNFGGLEKVDPVRIFYSKLSKLVNKHEERREDDPDCTSAGMIQACLTGDSTNSESRYLLLLTENYGALTILQQKIFNMHNAVIIFGSSFPSDQEYTQVCRNINRIKVCMETGSTVILLNLENLYESLYDALNQYYVEFGGERYVDLGLGTHRVKCRVHRSFRLIVVAEKQIVYNKFPIPLINRLEKHFLSLKTMLTPSQLELTEKLQKWAQGFSEAKVPAYMRKQKEARKIGDAFMGYHADTCAAIILHVCQEKRCDDDAITQIEKEILHDAKSILLWCATPASVWQLEDLGVFNTYFIEQHHDSLADYLHYKIVTENKDNIYAQITTNSKLMSSADIEILCKFIPVQRQNVTLLTLQSFDTEQQFSRQLKSSFDQKGASDMLLIVQCDCGDQNADLVACARYTVQGELQQIQEDRIDGIHVVFLIQLPGIAGGCFSGFQCGLWHSVHIDELQPAPDEIPSISEMHGKSVSDLLAAKQKKKHVQMEIDTDPAIDSDEHMETTEPVELMDIELEEEAKDRIFKPKRQFNVSYLIERCIQPALGNVKDPAGDSNRALKRLTIVLNRIKDSRGDFNFMSGITKHLSSILVEKEQSSSLVTNWLSAEASKPENINRAGTFRRFAVHCLESKVIPLLAGIVAFIDTNRNIDMLTENVGWKTDIWMQIFNDPQLTQLRYEFIVSPTRQKELEEVLVKTTSMEGRVFSSIMPFSWLIYQKIDEVLRNTLNRADATDGIPFGKDKHIEVVIKATETFQELPLGKMLSSMEGTYIHDILKAYIVDFVHMVHPIQSQEECDLVCESVVVGCKRLIRGDYGQLLISLIGCHMTYILNDTRFKNFSHIVHVWPGCSKKIIEFQKKESNFYLVTEEEITLDILALHILMSHLEPNKEALNKLESRTKWLRQVCDYRPIVERIFGHFNQDTENKECQYGQMCQKGIEQARNQWTRAVVVKLFIEHVCTVGKDEVDIKHCMPLWATFREGADLKDIKSLEKVERYLRLCNKGIVKKCFGDQIKCVSCENNIEGAPVRLPCDHIICRRCFNDCLTLKEFVCPDCQNEFPPDLDPDKSGNHGEIKKFLDYRRRCNSFFMEVVSQLCFAEGTPPSQQVIEKLLSYILGRTKKVERVVSRELTIFDDCIDPTPVVRSFLLQQLMQTSNHEIETHLQAYFEYAGHLVTATGDNQQQVIELCLLILQCMEDFLHQQNANRDDEITMVTRYLRDAGQNVTHPQIELLDKIDYLSKVRFSLSIVAKYIHKLYASTQSTMPDPVIRRMFDQAARLCDECGSQWPRRYFVKQLCRCYGIDSYQIVCKNGASFLRWVRLPELGENKVKECHDRYVVMGDEYKELRETVVTTVFNENGEKLQQLLQISTNDWQTRIKLLLALHREITMNNVYGGQPQKFTDKGKAFIQDLVTNQIMTKNKEVAERILTNTLWRIPGNIDPGMDLADQNIACLLTHYFILMAQIPGKTTLLSPLQRIALDPQSMVTSYYPTMPQDELAEIKQAVMAAKGGENPMFYRCPNGHPYVIGNCGRATTVGSCKACGRDIGGEGYQLRPGNELHQEVDKTETGHILGSSAKLGPITAPERKLSRPAFAILRLLTHISMYLGANIHKQAICQSVKPIIKEDEVPTYLMEHIKLDLTSVQNVLGKNKDDVLVLIHYLMASVMDKHTMVIISENVPNKICGLTDKNSRAKWEEDFSSRYIDPVLQKMDTVIKGVNAQILNDKRLGSDPLLQILYETDGPPERQDINMLHEVPAVWRYRAMITVNHLRQHLDADTRKLPILRIFLKEDHHLRAIRFVPSIIRLQKMLVQKYNRKLDRAEATTLKIEEVRKQMRQDRRSKEFGNLLADYVEAWNCVRETLETYVCPANEILVTVDEKYCRTEITEKTPISHLIPTHKDAGLSSYVLLFFLLKKQNIFLQNYCSKCKLKEDSLPKVHVKDISSAHLISYHPDRDLLPMVLANCNYSFKVGEGTRVEYNFTNLERQLMDRFLFSKSIVNSIHEMETITYRSESTNAEVFRSLYDRIKQERINSAVQGQICGDVRMKSYPDLCESLDKLDIAISFLKSVGSDPESSLHRFMTDTLKMENPFPSPKAQQSAKCKHTMSLWITFAMERAKFLAKYDKKAFEGISDNFKKPLTDVQTGALEDILNRLPIEQLDGLVELLFECIVLKIDVPQNMDDEDYVDISKVSLRDALIGYIDACPYEEDLIIDNTLMTSIGQIPSDKEDPQQILTGQSVEVWCLVNRIFTSKQRQRH